MLWGYSLGPCTGLIQALYLVGTSKKSVPEMAIDIRDIRDMDHIIVTQDISSIDIRSISFALPR